MARKKRTAEAAGTPAAVSRDEGSSVCANSSETNSKAASQPPPPQVGTRSAAHQRQTAPSNAALSAGNSAGGGSKSSRPSEATHGQAAVRETVVAASRSSPAADVSPSPAQQPASSPVDMEGLTPCQRRNLKKKIKQREMKQREQQRRLEEEEAQQQGGDGQSGELRCTYTPRLRDWEARLARLEAQSARAGAAAEQPSKEFSQGLSQLERDLDKALKELQEERLPQLKRPSTAPFKLRAQVASLQKTLDEKQRKLERAQERAARGLVEGDADELSREVEEARTYLAYSRRLLDSAEQFYFARDVLTRIGEMQTALRLLAKRVPKAGAAAGGGAEGAAAVASGRRAQREGVWLRRLEEMGVHVDKSALDADASALCTLQVTLPSEAVCVLFLPQGQPTLVLRQLQRRFSVVVDRIGSGTSGSQGALPVRQGAPLSLLLVSNAAENCERCRAFLAECNFVDIPGGLADAPNALQIPSNALSFIIGAGGRKIRALEEELQVLLYVESSWVVVLGEKAHVKQAIAKLQELAASAGKAPSSNRETRAASGSSSSQTQSVSLPTAVVRALAQGSLGARAALKRIEEQFGVLCTPRPPRREAESEEAVVFVRVSSANSSPASANANSAAAASSSTPSESGVSPRLAQAAAELRAFADTLRAEAIDCASQVATRVLRGDVFARLSAQEKELSSLLRQGSGVLLVAPKDFFEAAKNAVTEALSASARHQASLRVSAADLRVLTRARRAEVEVASGAQCRAPQIEGDAAVLTFSGSAEQVAKAVELAEQILAQQQQTHLAVSLPVALFLLADRATKVRALEQDLDLRLRVEPQALRVQIRGGGSASEDSRAKLCEALEEVEREVESLALKAAKLPFAREELPAVIGREGSSIRRIQADGGAAHVAVDDATPALLVLGTEAALTATAEALKECLENGGSRVQNGLESGSGAAARGSRGGRGAGRGRAGVQSFRGRGGAVGTRGGACHKPQTSQPYDASAQDEDAFPSLESAGGAAAAPLQQQPHSKAAADSLAPAEAAAA